MGNYRTYSIPSKTAALVPEFKMEDLPSAELGPMFLDLHVVLLISLEIMRKMYISWFILQGRNIILKNILYVRCSLRKIK